jgi:hypothetical protein
MLPRGRKVFWPVNSTESGAYLHLANQELPFGISYGFFT